MMACVIAVLLLSFGTSLTNERSILRLSIGKRFRYASDDEPGVFRDFNELTGGEQIAFPMLPAHERFHADDRAALRFDHRLIMQHELVALERAAQLRFEREPLDRMHVDLVGIELERVSPL